MTNTSMTSFAIFAALAMTALGTVLLATSAEAGGRGKEYFSETYTFDKPMHGVEGRVGNYYCSYVRTPVHKIVNGKMKVVAWQLEQHCY